MASGKQALMLLLMLCSGCLGKFSKFDGTGPIPLEQPHRGWREQGGGEHGAIVKQIGKEKSFAQMAFSNQRTFQFDKSLVASLSTSDGLIRCNGEQVFMHRFGFTGMSQGKLLAEAKDIKEIDFQQPILALRTPNGIYIKKPKKKLEHFYKGPSLALSLDIPRDSLWIIKNVPCAVLEYWDLSTNDIRLRIPLPIELESAHLCIVRAKDHIAVYAYDRPLDNALFIDVSKQRVTSLSGIIEKLPPSQELIPSSPPLLIPHSKNLGERISMPGQRKLLGRIVPFNEVEFMILTTSLQRSNSLSAFESPSPRANSSFVIIDSKFQKRTLYPPLDWPRDFEAIGWDKQGIILLNGQRRFFVSANGEMSSKKELNIGNETKKASNRFFNVFVAAGELGVFIPACVAVGGVIIVGLPIWLLFGAR